MFSCKRLTATVLVAALFASSSIAAIPAEAKTFNDVSRTHWAYHVIDRVSNQGMMQGMGGGIFAPDTKLTRAQYTQVLYNLAPTKELGNVYVYITDIANNAWYKDVATWGVSNGIIFNVHYGVFAGEKQVTREYMALMTYYFFDRYYPNLLDENVYGMSYSDQNEIEDHLKKAVMILTHNGLLNGRSGNKFEPKAILTRAETATMVTRIQDTIRNAGGIQPQPPVTPPTPQPPAIEEGHRAPGDENAPAWMVEIPGYKDGKEQTIYIHKPDSFNASQWEELKEYYQNKQRPSDYPDYISSDIRNPQAYMTFYLEDLYKDVQRTKAKAALEAGTANLTAEEQKMVDLVNAQRRKAGVPELIVSPALCKAAKIRAAEANTKYSHERPNGKDCETVIDDLGIVYPFIDSIGGTHGEAIVYTENLAGNIGPRPKSAYTAMQGLMNSTGHRNNMLRENKVYIGVASVSNGNRHAWIQAFGYIQ